MYHITKVIITICMLNYCEHLKYVRKSQNLSGTNKSQLSPSSTKSNDTHDSGSSGTPGDMLSPNRTC